MKHLFITFLLLFSLGHAQEQKEALSLEGAVQQALRHNYSLLAQRIQAHAPSLETERERAAFRWQLTPQVELRRNESGDAVGRAGVDLQKKLPQGGYFRSVADWEQREDTTSERIELSLSQPLFRRFGRAYAERALDDARSRGEAAEWELLRFTASLIVQTVHALSEVQQTRQQIRMEEEALVRSHELTRLVGLRERQGQASRVEVMEVGMLHREAQLRLADVESRFRGARANLAVLLGITEAQLPPVAGLVVPPLSVPPLQEAVALAMRNRPERALALLRYEDARRHLTLERRELYPDLRLLTRWRPVAGEAGDAWSVGIAGGQGLTRRRRELDISLQEEQVEQALLHIAATELELQREVGNAIRRLERVGRQLTLNREQAEVAQARLRLAKRLYDKQRGDVLSVREAEKVFVKVEQDWLQARIEQLRAQVAFLHAVGGLVAEDSEGHPGQALP